MIAEEKIIGYDKDKVDFWKAAYLAGLNRNVPPVDAEEQAWIAVDHLRNFMRSEESR